MFPNACRLLVVYALTIAFAASAQKRAMTFAEFRNLHGGTSLDSSYRTALNVDSTKAVFSGRKEELHDAWQGFLEGLGEYLKENDFKWEQDARCTVKVYFNMEGGVDHFLYSFREGGADEGQLAMFDRLLNRFVETLEFPLKANEGFSQCGSILFRAAQEKPSDVTP